LQPFSAETKAAINSRSPSENADSRLMMISRKAPMALDVSGNSLNTSMCERARGLLVG
jgi:hypothetical protein